MENPELPDGMENPELNSNGVAARF